MEFYGILQIEEGVIYKFRAVNEKWLTARFVFTIKQRDISRLTKMVTCDFVFFTLNR